MYGCINETGEQEFLQASSSVQAENSLSTPCREQTKVYLSNTPFEVVRGFVSISSL